MGQLNTAQGGKDYLLKKSNEFSGSVTLQNSGDTVTKNAHGLISGTPVKFTGVTSGGLTDSTVYYVITPLTNTFQVALTPGGAAVPITADVTSGALAVEHFATIGGLRSKSFSLKAEGVDITNHGSNQWKTMLAGAGINSVAISGAGVFEDEWSVNLMRANALNRTINKFRLITNTAGDYLEGNFKLNSFEQAGDYDKEETWSVGMDSSGAVTYTEV